MAYFQVKSQTSGWLRKLEDATTPAHERLYQLVIRNEKEQIFELVADIPTDEINWRNSTSNGLSALGLACWDGKGVIAELLLQHVSLSFLFLQRAEVKQCEVSGASLAGNTRGQRGVYSLNHGLSSLLDIHHHHVAKNTTHTLVVV